MAGATNAWTSEVADLFTGNASDNTQAFPADLRIRLGSGGSEAGAFTEVSFTGYSEITVSKTPTRTFGSATNGAFTNAVLLDFGTRTNAGAAIDAADADEIAVWDNSNSRYVLFGTISSPQDIYESTHVTVPIGQCTIDFNAN